MARALEGEIRPEVVREARKQWERGCVVDGSKLTLPELDELFYPRFTTLDEIVGPFILKMRKAKTFGGIFGKLFGM
ncbi:hypothetical protein HY385_02150 [Candidatus Daviesbacteria bacterium]|nr:hypothetical protein [Candidatus Daviesbacteria bacterium]